MSNKVFLALVLSFLALGTSLVNGIFMFLTFGSLFHLVLAVLSHLAMCYIIGLGQEDAIHSGWAHYWYVTVIWTIVVLACLAFVLLLL